MLILNFSHPLTTEQQEAIERLTGAPVEEVRTIPVQMEPVAVRGSLAERIAALVDAAGLTSDEWQTRRLLINPPGLAAATAALLAEIHGRAGHFPGFLYLEWSDGGFQVAEVTNLQHVRDQARRKRS